MDSQSAVQDAIHRSTQVDSRDTYRLLNGTPAVATSLHQQDDYNAEAMSVLARVPGIGLAYRLVKNWHHEFSPRVYGDQAVLVRTSSDTEK